MKKLIVIFVLLVFLAGADVAQAKRNSESFAIEGGAVLVEATERSGGNAWSECVYFENELGGDYLGHYGEPVATGDLVTFCAVHFEDRTD